MKKNFNVEKCLNIVNVRNFIFRSLIDMKQYFERNKLYSTIKNTKNVVAVLELDLCFI